MQVYSNPDRREWTSILARPTLDFAEIEGKVQPILDAVIKQGDEALRHYALEFDNVLLNEFELSKSELEKAGEQIPEKLKEAIHVAFQNVSKFHKAQEQAPEVIETMPGVSCWRKSVGIEKVGIYIPGGTAPLFSTVLMLGIPAKLAGCKEIVLCSPSNHPAILYAAHLVGVTRFFRIGGAQAIAAMAYGTESVPKVYKIFGPGNQYVTAAKQLVNKTGTAIDMPAGPSEVAVYADETAEAEFVAADLLSQAEHGFDSQVVLVCDTEAVYKAIEKELTEQLAVLPRRDFAEKSISNSKAIILEKKEEAIDLLNAYAAEHLILSIRDAEVVLEQISNAGSVFLGNYTPESCGDYASGTNHTLPTNGFAKAYSGVSLDSFVKKITVQKITAEGLKNLGPHVEEMAKAESLDGHANAVSLRLRKL
ncbi:histidinol dehydrogenase [Marinilongibacter aquaticus]|uniref:histidinol dehydrogenase n=1 Tax=Marinilongibacter aquaticus TaxID=2975157 RepID=UPI0021BDCAF4|nr:histidinol dehydrogenase [Marinilongibacter aquaticus]UBM59446.1 histidinol dehydrogenase [Marinilongibacter aquaticus]